MNKKLNIAAIAIIIIGLCALGFVKLSRYNANRNIAAEVQLAEKHIDTAGQYEGLYTDTQVLISDAVSQNINTVIQNLDSNLLYKGREVSQTAHPAIAREVVDNAAKRSGIGTKVTSFRGDYFEDGVVVTVYTFYDKNSLKLLKSWEQPASTEHFDYIETRYAYSANIKVEYEVTVDGEEYKGVYYQQSQINSPMDLLYN